MVLLTRYKHLRKADEDGTFSFFRPLRAVGLAVEAGHKAAQRKGLSRVTADDLAEVRVYGSLQVKDGERWRSAKKCNLQLKAAESELALAVVLKQRSLLSDLGINIWRVDAEMKCGTGSFDLLGDFSGSKRFGVDGKLWIELKVFDAAGSFNVLVLNTQNELSESLVREFARDSNLGGVLLLAAKVEKQGATWKVLSFFASVCVAGQRQWQDLVGQVKRIGRGQSPCKPALAQVWDSMEWMTGASGEKVGLLKHFLAAMALCDKQPGERAIAFNSLLQQGGHAGRIRHERVETRGGRKPWVATKSTFRSLYPFL